MRLCLALVEVKTVIHYELIIKALRDLIPQDLVQWLDWWDARRWNVFGPFRGFTEPGVNLAEIGNSAWNRDYQISLVEAANDDVTTTMINEEEYRRWKSDQQPAPMAKGPTDMQRVQKKLAKQIEAAKQSRDMWCTEVGVRAQLENARYPNFFMPSKGAKHKPTGKSTQGKGKSNKKGKGRQRIVPTMNQLDLQSLANQLNIAKQVRMNEQIQACNSEQLDLGKSTTLRPVRPVPSTAADPNPPTIIRASGLISVCQGCPDPIDVKNMEPPRDLVFRLKAVRPFFDGKTQLYTDKINNGYFHLKRSCLLNHNPKIKWNEVVMPAQTFVDCGEEHFAFLKECGFLDEVMANLKVD